MPEMQSYMGVNEGNDGIIGKLLYYSISKHFNTEGQIY